MQEKNGWTSPELAIHGGAQFLQNEYLKYYQDTGYLQKYSVDPAGGNLYKYQYMQNVSAPYSEGRTTKKAYIDMGLMDSGFNFIVPVFENMPEMASPRPGRNISLVTENVVIATQSSPLTIRSGPGTSYNQVARASKGSILLRIEKANEAEGGIYWDKVIYSTENGVKVGYATREYLGDVNSTQTCNEPKITTEICNLRNGPGTTESRVKQILSVGTPLTVIDRINTSIDGHIWCRVRLEDGTEGYVSSEFLQDGVVEKYKIEGTYVKIIPETTIEDIPGAVLNGDVLGTGAIVTIDGVEYTLVVKGDINGDAEVDVVDLALLKRHLIGTTTLTGNYYSAGILQKSGTEIDVIDLALLKRFLIGTARISL